MFSTGGQRVNINEMCDSSVDQFNLLNTIYMTSSDHINKVISIDNLHHKLHHNNTETLALALIYPADASLQNCFHNQNVGLLL